MKLTAQKTEISPIEDYISTDYNPLNLNYGQYIMKKTVNLPLYNEFINIFSNHQIKSWQAKHFWKEMDLKPPYRTKRHKSLMYSALKMLLKYNYLELNIEKSTKKTFSYNETPRLNELRNKHKKQKLDQIFSRKKTEILCEIREKENNLKFIHSLALMDKSLEKFFIDHQNNLEMDIRNMNSNLKFMEEILN